jgi:hypothetical protein
MPGHESAASVAWRVMSMERANLLRRVTLALECIG